MATLTQKLPRLSDFVGEFCMDFMGQLHRINEPEQVLVAPDGLYTDPYKEGFMSDQFTALFPEIEYRNIPGFPGYRVGDDGSVWCCRRKGGNDRSANRFTSVWRRMKLHQHDGYARVNLVRDGRNVSRAVHCIVLEAFVGPCPPGMEACHYPDTTRSNNRRENLRWDTHSENMRDKFRDRIGRESKPCNRCREVKGLEEFYTDARALDGRKTECKRCHMDTSMLTRDKEAHRRCNRAYMRRVRSGA
jgi:hypothetical protein